MTSLVWACLCLQPAVGDTAMDEGMAQLRNKNYTQAFYSFETAKRNPSSAPEASYYQAMCYYGLGKVDYARTMLRTTIDRYPQAQIAGTAREALDRINREGTGTAASAGANTPAGTASEDSGQSAEVSYKRDRSGRMIVNVLLNGKTLTRCWSTPAQTFVR
ncbi:MAG: tetratricopeptide repeat protein [Candidatus Obscuribacterales bacterium]